MATKKKTLFGNDLSEGRIALMKGEPWCKLTDVYTGEALRLGEDVLSRHVCVLGSTGSGKTNVIDLILRQLREMSHTEEASIVVLDAKGDYLLRFWRDGDVLIGNSRAYRDISVAWNIFDEAMADGNDPRDIEANAREIASVLFAGRGSEAQPFFVNAAREIFAAVIVYFVRRAAEDPEGWKDMLNNAELRKLLLKVSAKELIVMFKRYEDMAGLVSYIGDGSTAQALGVMGELRSMVSDCLQGVFAQRPPAGEKGFSVRNFVRRKGGRALFVEYDLALGHTLQPMYRLLFDLAFKESMGSEAHGRTLYFLDELRLLPKLDHLQDALNFGRSKGVSVVAGLQSVEQMTSAYGEELGKVILGGFGSLVAMRTSDAHTREYVTRHFGPCVRAYRFQGWNGQPVDREREGNAVEPWDVQRLGLGDAIVGLATQSEPFCFTFEKDGE